MELLVKLLFLNALSISAQQDYDTTEQPVFSVPSSPSSSCPAPSGDNESWVTPSVDSISPWQNVIALGNETLGNATTLKVTFARQFDRLVEPPFAFYAFLNRNIHRDECSTNFISLQCSFYYRTLPGESRLTCRCI